MNQFALETLENLVKKATLIGAPLCINQDDGNDKFYAFIMCSGATPSHYDSEETLVEKPAVCPAAISIR